MSDETTSLTPQSSYAEERPESVLAEYLRRVEQGGEVNQQALLASNPDLADGSTTGIRLNNAVRYRTCSAHRWYKRRAQPQSCERTIRRNYCHTLFRDIWHSVCLYVVPHISLSLAERLAKWSIGSNLHF